ncbi:MAG: amidohydrolase family protein [Dehalococcoidales bacterium]|nr:amidohydrolase family protein [Dehalococcoidales bacterium]
MGSLAITNIGALVSGDLKRPLLAADTVLVRDGKIAAIGDRSILSGVQADKTVDAQGITLIPGLIDSHVHPVLGDFSPRQKTLDFIDSSLHGGVTSMISAGEPHLPGRPKDPLGVKALAILAALSFKNARPGGVKVHGGALILEPGLKEEDFAELKEAGVWLVGEVGLGGVRKPEDAGPMVAWAHKYGFKVVMHTGGTSIPGSSTVTAEDVIAIKPDVVSHINGGTTAVAPGEIEKIVESTDFAIEIVQCGNPKAALRAAAILSARNQLERLILGNDAPSGTGIIPLGMLRNLAFLASVGGLEPAQVIAAGSGNTARVFGLPTGIVEIGREADLVLLDAPMGSFGKDALDALAVGDIPGVAMVIIDGEIKTGISRNTPPPTKKPVLK